MSKLHRRVSLFFFYGLLFVWPISTGQTAVAETTPSTPPVEMIEINDQAITIKPEQLLDPLVPAVPQAVITATLSFSPTQVMPGGPLSLNIQLSNIGTSDTTAPYTLLFHLDKNLILSDTLPAGIITNTWLLTSTTSLATGSSQSWQIPLQLSEQAQANQTVNLVAYDVTGMNPGPVRASQTLMVTGAVGQSIRATESADEDKGWMPNFIAPNVSLFSGAATYGYSFDVAPGRHGMQPNLGLNYSSSSVNSATAWTHSGEVGEGWSVSGIPSITRQDVAYCWEGNTQWICPVNRFSLVLNGASYNLVATSNNPYGVYQAEGNPGLYIERRNAEGVAGGYGGSSANRTTEYWVVKTSDGTTWRFGYNEDSEQIIFRTNTDPNDPNTPYVGEVANIATYRWWLDQAKDVYGNGMVISYLDDGRRLASGGDGCGAYCREVATYPSVISYNNAVAGTLANWQSTVEFTYADAGTPVVDGAPIFATVNRLSAVTMKQGTQTLWRYSMSYTLNVNPDYSHIVTLDSIQQQHFDNSGVLVTPNPLPPASFTYVNLHNGYVCLTPNNPCPFGDRLHFYYPRLETVKNGYGGVYQFTYAQLDYNTKRNFYVTDVKSWDGFQQPYVANPLSAPTTHIQYLYNTADACYDDWQADPSCDLGPGNDSNSLVGFDTARVKVFNGGDSVVLSDTTTTFHVGNRFYTGKQQWQGVYHPNGTTLLSETNTTWVDNTADCLSTGLSFSLVCQTQQETKQYYYPAGGGVTSLRTWQRTYYNPAWQGDGTRQWGVPTQVDTFYNDLSGAEVLESHQITKYKINNTNWVVVPWMSGTFDNAWNAKALTFNLYDGQSDPDDQAITIGKLTMSRVALMANVGSGGNTEYETIDTSFVYDSYGNQTEVRTYTNYGRIGYTVGSSNWNIYTPFASGTMRKSTTVYMNNGLQVQYLRNPLYPTFPQTSFTYHTRFYWLPLSTTDANNRTTSYEYDHAARLVKVARPGDTLTNPSLQYVYTLNTSNTPLRIDKILLPNGGTTLRQQTVQFINGLGQVVQNNQVGMNMSDYGLGDVATFTSYDALGRQICQSSPLPFANNSGYITTTPCEAATTPHTTTHYDYRGKVDLVTYPDGTTTSTTYSIPGSWATTVGRGLQQDWIENANGDITLNTYDAFGRLDWVGQKDDGGPCSALQVTTYDYDTAGNLQDVWRGGNVCGSTYTPGTVNSHMVYDGAGRKTEMTDPDMGSWDYSYDPAGNLTRQTDAFADPDTGALCFYYDALGRQTHKAQDSTPGTSCPTSPPAAPDLLATYTYGTALNSWGQLTQVSWGETPAQNYETFAYNALGEMTSHTRRIDNTAYTMTYSNFDLLHRPTTITYPNGEAATIGYDHEGENSLTAGGTALVNNIFYNSRGQMTTLDRATSADTTYAYYNATGTAGNSNYRLSGIQAGTLLDLSYSYNSTGNITALTDNLLGNTQTFTYDHLSRLINASAPATGGMSSYSHAYTYDMLGNIKTYAGTTYGYDAAHPHAVTKLNNVQKFWYDANGNMTQRIEDGVTYNQTFDVENRLESVTVGSDSTSFVYDASGQRVKTVQPDGTVLHYPFPGYEVTNPGQIGSTNRTTYTIAGQAVAQKEKGLALGETFDDGNSTGWTAHAGTWAISNAINVGSSYRQSNSTHTATNSSRALSQSGSMAFEWEVTFESGIAAAGMHLFASEASSSNHGDSYLVWQNATDLMIYKSSGNNLVLQTSTLLSNANGQTHRYKVTYNPTNGQFAVWRDGVSVLNWTDSNTPHSSGSYIALRTNKSVVRFDNIRITGNPATTSTLYHLYGDHLGSTSVLADSSGQVVDKTYYLPFGEYRRGDSSILTESGFTGHLHNDNLGLIYMNARFYSPSSGRFITADTIIPSPTNPQSYNRYSYVYNNPLRHVDPSGHCGRDMIGDREDIALLNHCMTLRDGYEEYYHIDIDGTWTYAEMLVIGLALQDLEAGLGGPSYFREVFNTLTINRVNQRFTDSGGFAEVNLLDPNYINVADETFAFGDALARFIILHESEHILDGRYDGVFAESHFGDTGAQCLTSICNEGEYIPGIGGFSQGAWRGPFEDPADTWAAYLYDGDWADLVETLDLGGTPFVFSNPRWGPHLPGGDSRLIWANEQIQALQVQVDFSIQRGR